jgi:hypothetical protein
MKDRPLPPVGTPLGAAQSSTACQAKPLVDHLAVPSIPLWPRMVTLAIPKRYHFQSMSYFSAALFGMPGSTVVPGQPCDLDPTERDPSPCATHGSPAHIRLNARTGLL